MAKYKILYKSSDAYAGWDFLNEDGGEWDTVDAAVKALLSSWANGNEFIVIREVEWEAQANETTTKR